jgi:tetratricopeptide (TPR) repeat protein
LKDTSAALKLEPSLSKAYYRSGQALLALDRVDEALDVCDRCIAFDPTNDGMRTLRDKIVGRKELKEKVEREREERKKREQQAKQIMNLAFRVSAVLVECAGYSFEVRNVISSMCPSLMALPTHTSRIGTLRTPRH